MLKQLGPVRQLKALCLVLTATYILVAISGCQPAKRSKRAVTQQAQAEKSYPVEGKPLQLPGYEDFFRSEKSAESGESRNSEAFFELPAPTAPVPNYGQEERRKHIITRPSVVVPLERDKLAELGIQQGFEDQAGAKNENEPGGGATSKQTETYFTSMEEKIPKSFLLSPAAGDSRSANLKLFSRPLLTSEEGLKPVFIRSMYEGYISNLFPLNEELPKELTIKVDQAKKKAASYKMLLDESRSESADELQLLKKAVHRSELEVQKASDNVEAYRRKVSRVGLWKVDQRNQVRLLEIPDLRDNPLNWPVISDMKRDRLGRLWLVSATSGVYLEEPSHSDRFVRIAKEFPAESITFSPDGNQVLLAGQRVGRGVIDAKDMSEIRAKLQDENSPIKTIGHNGLVELPLKAAAANYDVRKDAVLDDAFSENTLFKVETGADGRLWVATNRGLYFRDDSRQWTPMFYLGDRPFYGLQAFKNRIYFGSDFGAYVSTGDRVVVEIQSKSNDEKHRFNIDKVTPIFSAEFGQFVKVAEFQGDEVLITTSHLFIYENGDWKTPIHAVHSTHLGFTIGSQRLTSMSVEKNGQALLIGGLDEVRVIEAKDWGAFKKAMFDLRTAGPRTEQQRTIYDTF